MHMEESHSRIELIFAAPVPPPHQTPAAASDKPTIAAPGPLHARNFAASSDEPIFAAQGDGQ